MVEDAVLTDEDDHVLDGRFGMRSFISFILLALSSAGWAETGTANGVIVTKSRPAIARSRHVRRTGTDTRAISPSILD